MKTCGAALIALLLVGCGGGGSDDPVVSANPPAAPPPSATAPSPSLAPAPSPVTTVPPAPSPAPKPDPMNPAQPAPALPSPAPVPPGPSISAAVLSTAIGTQITGPVAANSVATLTMPPATLAYVSQDWKTDATYTTNYFHSSDGYPQTGSARYDLASLTLHATEQLVPQADGSYRGNWIGPNMTANGVNLTRGGAFDATDPVVLNRTIAQWDASPWFAQLQVQVDDSSDTVFRLCWHVKLPSIIRLSCGKFDRVTGDYRGAHIVDDSQGIGALTWVTKGTETWPPYVAPAPRPAPAPRR